MIPRNNQSPDKPLGILLVGDTKEQQKFIEQLGARAGLSFAQKKEITINNQIIKIFDTRKQTITTLLRPEMHDKVLVVYCGAESNAEKMHQLKEKLKLGDNVNIKYYQYSEKQPPMQFLINEVEKAIFNKKNEELIEQQKQEVLQRQQQAVSEKEQQEIRKQDRREFFRIFFDTLRSCVNDPFWKDKDKGFFGGLQTPDFINKYIKICNEADAAYASNKRDSNKIDTMINKFKEVHAKETESTHTSTLFSTFNAAIKNAIEAENSEGMKALEGFRNTHMRISLNAAPLAEKAPKPYDRDL